MNQRDLFADKTRLIGLQMADKMPANIAVFWVAELGRFILPFLHIGLPKLALAGVEKRANRVDRMGLTHRNERPGIDRAPRARARILDTLANRIEIIAKPLLGRRLG